MYIKIMPKNNAAANSIKKTGDRIQVVRLQREVSWSDKKDWFVCRSANTMIPEFYLHPKEDPNFVIVGGEV